MSAPTTGARPLTPVPQPQTLRRRRSGTLTHPHRTGLALVTPAVALVVVFVFVPLVVAVYISLTNFPLIGPYRFIGLDNYASVLTDPTFWGSLGYTLLYTAIVTLPILLLGYGLAVLVRSNRRGATLLRTIFFVPFVIGLTTLSFLTLLEAQPNSGLINVALKTLGITDGTTAWLVDGPLATGLLCVMVIWGVSGLTMVLLMSGMQGIPREVYESAEIDGATWWQRELQITVPMLRRTIAMTVILSVIGSFLAFTQFYILTQGGPGSDTTTIVMAIYRRAFVQLQLGAATAMSLVLVVITGLVTAAQFWLLRERS
ncbi:carbohydrate ABC transporter permease [Promicromonospora thailandica]|uniref:Multiple sugar transport system permease protein n=1 Tax=Promicromonospora thailandica TaxID=765201 RepID=A0A9X2JU73_9MICO|nr:sugar ABC transporter permease [Promicromonospora thailandica]MCP2262713.1 multiple sugar transport system permease protein [Promicromonospora thailandica]BFF18036.1 sugar ABC transporter permease [Promicromonospora thailandica]